MGRKATRTEEDKKLYNKEYYQKYKELHNRAYQLCGRRTYFNNMILTLQERLKDGSTANGAEGSARKLTPDKISKLNDRIEGYKQTLQEIENELKIERQSIWESDYHQNAEYKNKPAPTRVYKKRTPEEIEAEKNRPKRKYVKKTPEEREALKNKPKRKYTRRVNLDDNNSL